LKIILSIFFIKFSNINSIQIIFILNNQSIYYIIIKLDIFQELLDNKTTSISSAGESQVQVLQKKDLFIKLDIIITGTNHIKFNKEKIIIKGII
jgi:hypothetical protein